jgi:hypothetical protein
MHVQELQSVGARTEHATPRQQQKGLGPTSKHDMCTMREHHPLPVPCYLPNKHSLGQVVSLHHKHTTTRMRNRTNRNSFTTAKTVAPTAAQKQEEEAHGSPAAYAARLQYAQWSQQQDTQ